MDTVALSTTDIWNDCLQAWLNSLRVDTTRKVYQRSIGEFVKTTGIQIGMVTRRDVGDWITSMQNGKLAESTIRLRLSALSSFIEFARRDFTFDGKGIFVQDNPVGRQAQRVKISRYGKARPLSADETRNLLMQINTKTVIGKRDYALILGYVILGRRNSEWRQARVLDFENKDGRIFFRWSGKGKRDELLEVPGKVWDALREYIGASGERGMYDYIFLDRGCTRLISERRVGQIVKRYAEKAGITGRLRVHDLRHTATMLRRRAGADVRELQEFLGHTNPVTTMIYLHRLEGTRDIRASQVEELLKI